MSTEIRREVDAATAHLFSWLWIVGILFHYWNRLLKASLSIPYTAWPLIALSAFLLLRPGVPRLFMIACALQCADALGELFLEKVQVSWFFQAAISMRLLLAWLRGQRTIEGIVRDSAPTIRGFLLVLYAFAVLHKLNEGYFDPKFAFPRSHIERIPLVGTIGALTKNAAALGVATEALIGALLVVPRTRSLAVMIAAGLHGTLGYGGYSQFAFLFSIYLLFLWPAAGSLLVRRWGSIIPRRAWVPLAAVALCVASYAVLWGEGLGTKMFRDSVLWTALLAGVGISLGFFLYDLVGKQPGTPPPLRFGPGPIALSIWCFLPYFGLVSHPCIAMYSELRLDSGVSNHFFVPAALQINAIHDDTVRIGSVSDRKHRYPTGRIIPYATLRRALVTAARRGVAPKRLVFVRDGKEYQVNRGTFPDAHWSDHIPVLDYNYLLIQRAEATRAKARNKKVLRARKKRSRGVP